MGRGASVALCPCGNVSKIPVYLFIFIHYLFVFFGGGSRRRCSFFVGQGKEPAAGLEDGDGSETNCTGLNLQRRGHAKRHAKRHATPRRASGVEAALQCLPRGLTCPLSTPQPWHPFNRLKLSTPKVCRVQDRPGQGRCQTKSVRLITARAGPGYELRVLEMFKWALLAFQGMRCETKNKWQALPSQPPAGCRLDLLSRQSSLSATLLRLPWRQWL